MISAVSEQHSAVEDAHGFARGALTLVRSVRHGGAEDTLLRQYVELINERLSGTRWIAHARDYARGQWRRFGNVGISDEDVRVIDADGSGPAPLGDSASWSCMSPITMDRAPWPGLSSELDVPCVVMPATFSDGELAGCITAFAPASQDLLARLDDAGTLLWIARSRSRIQMLLDEQSGQYAALADFSPDVIWRLDEHHKIIYVNRAFDRGATSDRARALGRHVLDCVPIVARELFLSALHAVEGPKGRAEFVYHADNRRFSARLAPERDGDDRIVGIVVTLRDITEPFHLEMERQAAEVRAQVISEVARSVIYERRIHDEVAYISPSMRTVFGHSPDEVAHGGLAWWLDHIHPDDCTRVAEMFANQEGSLASQWSMEFRVRRADGSWATVLDQGRLLAATEHTPLRTVGALTDITALRALQMELHHAHRVELIGRLAGGVAHDFNNVLAAIGGFTDLLMQTTEDADPRSADLREIAALVQRASGLTQNLLGLSRRKDQAQPVVIEVASSVTRLTPTLRTLLGSGVELRIDAIPRSLRLHMDSGHLDQIILNLALNARDAMPDGGIVSLSATLEDVKPGSHERPRVRIDVGDRGLGIPADMLDKIFKPYFTTKAEGHGTGLGLSVVSDIVHSAGGEISVHSVPNEGTTFSVRLPQPKARVTPVTNEVIADDATLPGTIVLLIEDEETVRRSTRRILERSGYQVIEARTGDAGLASLIAHREFISAIVSDLCLPGLSGPPLIERLLREGGDIGCLVMSGHAERFSKLTSEKGRLLVQSKPCGAPKLLHHVKSLVDATNARRGR